MLCVAVHIVSDTNDARFIIVISMCLGLAQNCQVSVFQGWQRPKISILQNLNKSF